MSENKGDLISRKSLLEELKGFQKAAKGVHRALLTKLIEFVDEMPAVDAQPVVHGRWENVPNREVEHGEVVIRGTAERCTNCCHASKYYRKDFDRCPNCGAKMDGGDTYV